MSTLIQSVARAALWTLRLLATIVRALFGDLRWSPPPWMRRTATAAREWARRISRRLEESRAADPRRFWTAATSILVLIVAGAFGLNWYLNRPQPRYVELYVTWPQPTPLRPDATIDPLRLDFSKSAARLDAIGKIVTAGIRIEPPLAGVWKWENDAELTFTPASDWEV